MTLDRSMNEQIQPLVFNQIQQESEISGQPLIFNQVSEPLVFNQVSEPLVFNQVQQESGVGKSVKKKGNNRKVIKKLNPVNFMKKIPNRQVMREFFISKCKYYCPPQKDLNIQFCKDILSGKKALLKYQDVNWVENVP